MKKIISLIIIMISILLFLTYDSFVRKYEHKDSYSDYTMYHLNGCSLIFYIDGDNKSFRILYSCPNIKNINLKKDLYFLINHFDLKGQLEKNYSFELAISGNNIFFPMLLQDINSNKKWPKDFRYLFNNKTGEREEYLKLISDVINSSGYIENLRHVFSQYECKPHLRHSGVMGFMEYHSDNGSPVFYTFNDLIKQGVVGQQEITKKIYPMIDMLSLTCD